MDVINESVQWAVLALVCFLLLGVIRQVGLLVPAPESRGPASGPSVGQRLPGNLLARIREMRNGDGDGGTLLAFVTESCPACQRLIASLHDEAAPDLVIVAKAPAKPYRDALEALPYPVVFDDTGEIWREARINATPLLIRADTSGVVEAKEVTHHVNALSAQWQS